MEHVGTLVSLFLAPKISMDNTQSMLLSKVIDACVSNVAGSSKAKDRISKVLGRFKYPLTVGIPACYLAWKYSSYFQHYTRRISGDDIIYDVYDRVGITSFSNLFKHYTELFEIGSVEHGTYKNTGDTYSWVLPSVDTSFRLPAENVSGKMCALYIPTTKTQNKYDDNDHVSSSETVKIEKLFIRIVLTGNIISYASLLKIADNYYNEWSNAVNKRTITLYGVNVFLKYTSQSGMTMENIQSVILDMPRSEYDPNMYFETYFSPRKADFMKYCTLDQCNLLLYGPPGTGKSGLVRAMALYSGRHIVNVDLTVLTKRDAYQIMSCARIDGRNMQPHQYIIVFEEFDNTLRVFRDRERAKKLEEQAIRKKGEMSFARYKSSNVSSLKDNPDDSQLLQTSDLLALLQSSVPRRGQMVIATTNHFDKIKKVLPALFRPGRMTPVFIDYANRKTVSELITHFFPDTIEIPVLSIVHYVSTSQLVELAQIYHMDYTLFERNLREAARVAEIEALEALNKIDTDDFLSSDSTDVPPLELELDIPETLPETPETPETSETLPETSETIKLDIQPGSHIISDSAEDSAEDSTADTEITPFDPVEFEAQGLPWESDEVPSDWAAPTDNGAEWRHLATLTGS